MTGNFVECPVALSVSVCVVVGPSVVQRDCVQDGPRARKSRERGERWYTLSVDKVEDGGIQYLWFGIAPPLWCTAPPESTDLCTSSPQKRCDWHLQGVTRHQGCIGREAVPPPPPSRAPSLCPATVPLTPSASFNGDSNRP